MVHSKLPQRQGDAYFRIAISGADAGKPHFVFAGIQRRFVQVFDKKRIRVAEPEFLTFGQEVLVRPVVKNGREVMNPSNIFIPQLLSTAPIPII
ncbi:MAG: hypothetical protein FWC42_08670 [Proteobacteria bacterium]|nr:hypothetical protein [Pseudomonadota bacterium]